MRLQRYGENIWVCGRTQFLSYLKKKKTTRFLLFSGSPCKVIFYLCNTFITTVHLSSIHTQYGYRVFQINMGIKRWIGNCLCQELALCYLILMVKINLRLLTHLCLFGKSKFNIYEIILTASTLSHRLVRLIVCFINPMSVRYSTNWDRKGWPGSEIKVYYGCPWWERAHLNSLWILVTCVYWLLKVNILNVVVVVVAVYVVVYVCNSIKNGERHPSKHQRNQVN